jgi:phage gp29-like protein
VKNAPQILGPDGRPALGAERVEREKRDRFNPLAFWTPDVLTRQLVQFAQGELKPLAWVMEWLELHDDTIATVAPKAKAAVSRHGHDVVFADGVDNRNKSAAEAQRAFLETFYANLQTGDAMDPEEEGGMRLLVKQVMDAYGKHFGVHHIIWLPQRDGSLRAQLIKVPLWFFEKRTGKMRFLASSYAIEGVSLDSMGGRSAWMVAKGRGVMLAGCIARMFKQIPLQDWLTYCDRHGMPAFLGRTGAKKGEEGWNQMADAVASLGAEFGGVINTGDTIDVLSLAGSGEIPYEKLVDRMDRAQVMLWRGGDLSTMSRSNGVGSNPQADETDDLDADNAVWVEETLNANLTNPAIAWKFGRTAPVLAKLKLRTKPRVNVKEEIETVKAAREMGVRVSKSWFVSRFGVTEADADETALGETTAPATAPAEVNAMNSNPDMQALLKNSLATIAGVTAETLAPADAILAKLAAGVQDGGMTDAEWLQGFDALAAALPEFFDARYAADMAEELEAAMGTAVLQGVRQSINPQSK